MTAVALHWHLIDAPLEGLGELHVWPVSLEPSASSWHFAVEFKVIQRPQGQTTK